MVLLEKIPANSLQLAAIFTIFAFPLAILAARFELIHFRFSFLIFVIAALIAFIICVLALFKLSKGVESDGKPLLIALVLTVVPLITLGINIVKAKQYPFIHDISTDIENIPAFEAAAAARKEGDHSTEHEGSQIIEMQVEGYPNIKPILVKTEPTDVLSEVNTLIIEQGWEPLAVYSSAMPYRVEAVDTSLLFGFKDDVVIRIDLQPDGMTRIDMRSMSRQGQSDLGANANRIQNFLAKLEKKLAE